MPNIILKMVHGSHLYGTQTENSDRDYKSIYIPNLDNYLLQNVNNCISENTNNGSSKNNKDDIDSQIFSLNKFIQLCLNGDTYVIDMLHVNKENELITSDIWEDLKSKRKMFYTKNLYSYTGYLRQQAAKYSIKGSRLNDCEVLVKYLSQFNSDSRLEDYLKNIPELEAIKINEHYLEIIEKKFGFRTRLKDIIVPLNKFIEQYGERAKQAKKNLGIDWKAVSHAFRAGFQIKEIYQTGDLQYPLKNREFLLKVKTGQFHWVNDNIDKQLDDLLTELKQLSVKTNFPGKPNIEYWNQWLLDTLKNYYAM